MKTKIFTAALFFLRASSGWGQSFVSPVDNRNTTQWYASYNNGSPNKYHTGMDMINNSINNYSYSTPIKVAATGIVVKIFGLEINSNGNNNLRVWNSSTSTYSWVNAPTAGMNHGLGQCVIIYHSQLGLYTLYGHLDAVYSDISVGQTVTSGSVIGIMGNSYKQYLRECLTGNCNCGTPAGPYPSGYSSWSSLVVCDANGFGPHLHFEAKDRGILSASNDDNTTPWGYTPGNTGTNMPGHPNWFGYHDPNIFLNNTVQLLSSQVPLEITYLQSNPSINIRDYPSTSSSLSLVISSASQRSDGKTPAFVASRKVTSGSDVWYQIHLPNATIEGWSASGWIAGNVGGTQYSSENNSLCQMEINQLSAWIYQTASTSSTQLGGLYGGSTLNIPQRFIPFENPVGWFHIYSPDKLSQQDGWVSGNYASLVTSSGCVVSVSNIYNSIHIEIYPNPNTGTFTIETQEQESELTIVNILGEKVYQSIIQQLTNSTIDLSAQPNGIYFIHIKTEQGTATQKLIINK
ncbi:MAG: T9SS type A sorting domain-containing protein [Bacteroidetes bacterium]|nr:T9SS type A sorting domain-containing protein [Bacteroidota bacterium]